MLLVFSLSYNEYDYEFQQKIKVRNSNHTDIMVFIQVERFNQTLGDYFEKTLQDKKNWPEQLEDFYYSYNNRPHTGINNERPMDRYFRRPNFHYFGDQIPFNNLTEEEQNYLNAGDSDDEEQPVEIQAAEEQSIDIADDIEELEMPESILDKNMGLYTQ